MNKMRNQFRAGAAVFGWFGRFGILFITLALTGCSMLRIPSSPPKAQVNSLQLTTGATGPVTFQILQTQVMRFADNYVATVAQACDDASAKATNSEVRFAALRWKLGQATAAYNNATGENPVVNMLDMLVQVSLARMVVEDNGLKTYGDLARPLLLAQRNMESNAWMMARSVLKPSQQQELRSLIQDWRAKNPHQYYIAPIRFREFATALGKAPTQANVAPTSIFSLLYLDPLAGLDPTTAAITETRELGERAMYYSQRMPMLLNWQAQALVYQLARQPESRQILGDADQLASSAAIFAKTSQQLPQLINDQRQAAIQQILDGLTSEADKSRELLSDTRSTLNSAGDAASNINAAIKSLTEFVRYVSPTNETSASADTNSQPFNVLDYGTAASQIGAAADRLNALLTSMNQSAPQMEKLSRQMSADADRVTQHMFWLGLALIFIFLAGSVVAGLTYRILANRLAQAGRGSPEPKS